MQDPSPLTRGTDPVPPAVGAWSPNHWTPTEFPPVLTPYRTKIKLSE